MRPRVDLADDANVTTAVTCSLSSFWLASIDSTLSARRACSFEIVCV